MEEKGSKFGYLEELVQDQIKDFRSKWLLVDNVMDGISAAHGKIPVKTLVPSILSSLKLFVPNQDRLELLESPTYGSRPIKTVTRTETLLDLAREEGNWLRVRGAGEQGYVSIKSVTEKPPSESETEQYVDQIMEILQEFRRMEFIRFDTGDMGLSVEMTSKGRTMQDAMKQAN